ncbi:MAG TPA: Na-translocating system protein MpsC family protein [Solirubrobacteraceae bacterium]|jgi:uncharacterized protein YbcI
MSTSSEEPGPAGQERQVNVQMEVSNTLVRLFKEQFGRGPTSARTHWAGPDTLVCILDDTLTPAERNLVKLGEHQRLRDTRSFFQYASVRDFGHPVEQITGRTLRAFHSSTDTEASGQSAEVFVFHPVGYDGPSRIDRTSN